MSKLCKDIVDRLKNKNSHLDPFVSILKVSTLVKDSLKNIFTLELPSNLYKERIEKNYLHFFKKEISSVFGSDFKFKIIVSSKLKLSKKPSLPYQKQKSKTEVKNKYLFNSLYTLKTFVAGSSNFVILKLFEELAQKPFSSNYSSVFTYGNTGCGKTHLLHALGQDLLKNHPKIHLRYLSGEKFLQECVTSIRFNQIESFQKEFRNNNQVLLIDDIQEIEKGVRSQEELFHAFNSIIERGGLVVCSCDKLPSEIKRFQARIQTRLSGGLVLKINSSNLETRTDILTLKSKQKQIQLNQKTLEYIAKQSEKISIRELEGWLNKIKMVCSLTHAKPSINIVRDILSFNISPFSQTPEGYIQHLAQKNGLSFEKLTSSSRTKDVVFVRNQIILFVHKKFPYLSLSQIGNLFGRRSHSTILHSLKKAQGCNQSIYT